MIGVLEDLRDDLKNPPPNRVYINLPKRRLYDYFSECKRNSNLKYQVVKEPELDFLDIESITRTKARKRSIFENKDDESTRRDDQQEDDGEK